MSRRSGSGRGNKNQRGGGSAEHDHKPAPAASSSGSATGAPSTGPGLPASAEAGKTVAGGPDNSPSAGGTSGSDSGAAAVLPMPGAGSGKGTAGPLQAVMSVAHRTVELLTSVKLGLVLLALTVVWVAAGTMDVVLEAGDYAMIDWYIHPAFLILQYLLCLNLAVVTIRRIPFNLPNLGVWTIHGSILTLAAGATWFSLAQVDAVTRVDRGRSQSICYSHHHWEECLHVWRLGPTEGALRPGYDDGTGYGRGDLSEQHVLPRLTQHKMKGGAELTEGLLRELTPEAEVLQRMADALAKVGAPADVAERVRTADLLRGDRDHLRARLAATFTEAEVRQWTLTERALLARAEIEGAVKRLRTIQPRRMESAAVLGKRVRTALAPLAVSPRIAAILDGVKDDDYAPDPVVTPEGLRFTVERSWAKSHFAGPFVQNGEAGGSPSVETAWLSAEDKNRFQNTRRIFHAADAIAQRSDLVGRQELLDNFADRIRRAFDAADRKDADSAAAYAEEAVRRLRREASDIDGRVLVQRAGEFTEKEFAALKANWQPFRRGTAAKGPQGFRPPDPLEILILTDGRLMQPVAMDFADWRRTRTIEIDGLTGRDGRALTGVKLVLTDVVDAEAIAALRRGTPGGAGAEDDDRIRPHGFRYKVVQAGQADLSRACMNGITVDLGKLDQASPGGFRDAELPATAAMMLHSVIVHTAAVQVVGVRGADGTVREERLYWSLVPGSAPVRVEPTPEKMPSGHLIVGMQWRGTTTYMGVGESARPEWVLRPPETAADVPEARDRRMPLIRVRVDYTPKDGKPWTRTVWLTRMNFPDIHRIEMPGVFARLDVPGLGPVMLGWGGRRIPLGPEGALRARLEDMRVELMPGSQEQHKEYTSFVTFADGPGEGLGGDAAAGSGAAGGATRIRTVKICMNEPKKADRWWFSQNSYDAENRPPRFTVLSVSYKPGWSDPPLVPFAMTALVMGVLWAFLVKPWILNRRKNKARRLSGAGGDE